MRVTSVVFCDKVVNDCGSIYFPQTPRHTFFELIRFQLEKETLVGGIRKAYSFMLSEFCIIPDIIFIPFYEYQEYERHVDVTKSDSPIPLSAVCEDLGLQMVVMIPKELRTCIDSVLKIDIEI